MQFFQLGLGYMREFLHDALLEFGTQRRPGRILNDLQ
jgi:cation transport regulator ChaC